jgi:hypothetical protein
MKNRRGERQFSARQRLVEIGALLALGYLRLAARQSSEKPLNSAHNALDLPPGESVDRHHSGRQEGLA